MTDRQSLKVNSCGVCIQDFCLNNSKLTKTNLKYNYKASYTIKTVNSLKDWWIPHINFIGIFTMNYNLVGQIKITLFILSVHSPKIMSWLSSVRIAMSPAIFGGNVGEVTWLTCDGRCNWYADIGGGTTIFLNGVIPTVPVERFWILIWKQHYVATHILRFFFLKGINT